MNTGNYRRNNMKKECCHCQKRERSEEELKKLQNRLSRIEGQVRGIRRMLDEDAYCIDILTQVSAVDSALASFSRELIDQHLRTCVANDLASGNDEKVSELCDTLAKLIK